MTISQSAIDSFSAGKSKPIGRCVHKHFKERTRMPINAIKLKSKGTGMMSIRCIIIQNSLASALTSMFRQTVLDLKW